MYAPKGYSSKLKVPVPVTEPCTVTYFDSDSNLYSTELVTPVGGVVDVQVPYALSNESESLSIRVEFSIGSDDFTKTVDVDLYTPYVELWKIKKILETEDEFECWEAEADVRVAIENYCLQSFGIEKKSVSITGRDLSALHLPERLQSLSRVDCGEEKVFDIDDGTAKNYYFVSDSGWFLKSDFRREEFEYFSSDPIFAPGSRSGKFEASKQYTITGQWGYDPIPSAVVDAAELLLNDFACDEELYRDRYLESMKAADWRIQFNEGTYSRTGNARADMLLAPYIVNRMVLL